MSQHSDSAGGETGTSNPTLYQLRLSRCAAQSINQFMPNEISHCYQLDQSISVLNCPFPLGSIFHFYSIFSIIFCEQTVASDLVLHCLPMPHKKDAMLSWIKIVLHLI